jgi:class 3 adenylate cyclase
MGAPSTCADYAGAGERLLKAGEPLVAYDTLADGLKHFPTDRRLRQLLALALARTGASRLANQILSRLAAEGFDDEETLGLLARTHKDLWADSRNLTERQYHLQQAFLSYRDAHERTGGYWSGINAATTALLLGEADEATRIARRVRDVCLQKTAPGHAPEYWLLATLGEAALILRQWTEAEAWYSQAAAIGKGKYGDLASTRRNARLILRYLDDDPSRIDTSIHVPRVAVFAGHLIDRPDRPSPRFPPAFEPAVGSAIRNWLRTADVGVGYAAAACGSDILFLESVIANGAEARVVLPYNREQFRADSVDIVPGDWSERFDRVLQQAAEVVIGADHRTGSGSMSYEYGLLLLDGLAGLRADELDTELVGCAVWDGGVGDGPGGTADAIARWKADGRPLHVIDPAEIVGRDLSIRPPQLRSRTIQTPTASHVVAANGAARTFKPEIVGFLFGDTRGFTKLTEEEIPLFVEHALGAVAQELAESPAKPLLANTWGDGLYFVFRTVNDTGQFALRLAERMRNVDWTLHGLPKDLALRIGLHAGPAYACIDPVTNRLNYLGAHVSRAARIEPITPPGEVYASRAFAALARAEPNREFVCGYIGQTSLGKFSETVPLYVVHRRREHAM